MKEKTNKLLIQNLIKNILVLINQFFENKNIDINDKKLENNISYGFLINKECHNIPLEEVI